MKREVWYRSRLSWLAIVFGSFVIFIWTFSLVNKESRYIGARWIAPGDFYQGYGFSHGSHGMSLWLGRPYAGLGNPFRRTGTSNVTTPFDLQTDPWSIQKRWPVKIGWGRPYAPSSDSFRISLDYWFGVFTSIVILIFSAALRRRRLRLRLPTQNSNAQQDAAPDG